MKRDLGLMRELLLRIESSEALNIDLSALVGEDETNAEVGFNLILHTESGYISAKIGNNLDGEFHGFENHITPSGIDYLDSIRDPKIWRSVIERINSLGAGVAGVALEVVKAIAIDVVKSYLLP